MTTVTYSMIQRSACSNADFESDYSIHFNGKMTPQEFDNIMNGYRSIIMRFNPVKYTWIMIAAILVSTFFWFVPMMMIVNGYFVGIYFYVMVALFQFAVIMGTVYLRVRNIKRRLIDMESYTCQVNNQMLNRGINFRVRRQDNIYGSRYRSGYNNIKIEVEIAQQQFQQIPIITTLQQQQQQQQQPYYVSQQPPVYYANNNNNMMAPPPAYIESQPLLKQKIVD